MVCKCWSGVQGGGGAGVWILFNVSENIWGVWTIDPEGLNF